VAQDVGMDFASFATGGIHEMKANQTPHFSDRAAQRLAAYHRVTSILSASPGLVEATSEILQGDIADVQSSLGNQVAFWCALRVAGAGAQADDYGQVFRAKLKSK
jgi:hypothetical protein